MNEKARPLIMLLAVPETSASVLYGLYDVLMSVGAVYSDMVTGTPGQELLDVRIVSADGMPFQCMGGIPVEPHDAINKLVLPDAVIVCDMYITIHEAPKGRYQREGRWLKHLYDNGTLVTSVCSGSLLLAETGLLDGREATAHWAYRETFQRNYPKVLFRNESILCLSAESDRIVTAAGVSAWNDLAVYLIARYCGYQHAIETAKVFLISGHSEGQSPYSVMTRPMKSADGPISDCKEWIADHYAICNPVERMVKRSGLNARTFSRRFRAESGFSPIEYVQALRIEEAKQMLESGSLTVDELGALVGYEDPASFRRVFKRNVGQSPAAYRKKYQHISRISGMVGG